MVIQMSQTERNTDGNDVEYQLGSNDIDLSGSIADDDDVLEFNYESAAIFKRLADDIYETAEAGLREPLTNSITTSRRVQQSGECEDPVITITVKDGDQPMLRLRDMGEGISRSVLENVLLFIGRSTARDDGELSGQYGMGFLASYKLVGMNGGFIMHTNARNSSEGPYHGLFKPGAFEPDNEGNIQPLLGENEYGTVFEYFLKPGISISDVRGWVENHAQYSPIPIIYKEINEDGEEQYNEDYYSPTLKDSYGESPYLRVDTPYYEATTSPEADNNIVLISSPVTMFGKSALRNSLPWEVDLRIKYENGVVVKGPHEGLIPTTEKQYDMMGDERKKRYVSKERLTDEDLTLPEATGTRERVRRHKKFLQHVNNQLLEQYYEIVDDTLDTFNPSKDAMKNLDEMQRNILMRIFSHFDDDNNEYTENDVKNKLDSEYNYSNPSDELVEFILTMTKNVRIISQSKTYKSRYPTKVAYKFVEDNSEIYMCTAKSNSWKSNAVAISQQENEIVTVDKAAEYAEFSKHLGWTPLKNIKKSNVGEILGLNEEEIEEITKTSKKNSKNINDRYLTVHHRSGGRNTLSRTADYLISKYENNNTVRNNNSSRFGDVLVLFPTGGEQKISDNYNLADNGCCVASCSKKVSEYLTENAEGIVNYSDYKDWVVSQKLMTSNGTRTVRSLIDSNRSVILTPKSNVNNTILNDSIILSSFADYLKNSRNYSLKPTYAIIQYNLCKHIQSVYDVDDYNHMALFMTDKKINHTFNTSWYGNEVDVYAKTRLSTKQYESEEVTSITDSYSSLNENIVSFIEMLVQSSKANNNMFASQNEDNEQNIRMPTVLTKYGMIKFDEVYDYAKENNIIVHVIHPKNIHLFEDEEIIDFAGERLQGMELDNYKLPEINSNPIYVPILSSDYERVKSVISDKTKVIYSESRYNSVYIRDKYVYAAIKLPNFISNDVLSNLIRKKNISEVKNIVDTLSMNQNNNLVEKDLDNKESNVTTAKNALLHN